MYKVNWISKKMERYNYFPEDFEIEILCRLPIKSLLHFKCGCKSWYMLITSPNFVRLHLDKSISLNRIDYCLVRHDRECNKEEEEEEICLTLVSGKYMGPLADIEIPNIQGEKAFSIVGTCNGIICLKYDISFALLNPETKEFKVIPTPPELNPRYDGYHKPCPSFGFNAKSNDYKLLRVFCSVFNR